jgi:hypothetical protein
MTPVAPKQRNNHANRRWHPALILCTVILVFARASFFCLKDSARIVNFTRVISNAVDYANSTDVRDQELKG